MTLEKGVTALRNQLKVMAFTTVTFFFKIAKQSEKMLNDLEK